jgi:hypothetical protein
MMLRQAGIDVEKLMQYRSTVIDTVEEGDEDEDEEEDEEEEDELDYEGRSPGGGLMTQQQRRVQNLMQAWRIAHPGSEDYPAWFREQELGQMQPMQQEELLGWAQQQEAQAVIVQGEQGRQRETQTGMVGNGNGFSGQHSNGLNSQHSPRGGQQGSLSGRNGSSNGAVSTQLTDTRRAQAPIKFSV